MPCSHTLVLFNNVVTNDWFVGREHTPVAVPMPARSSHTTAGTLRPTAPVPGVVARELPHIPQRTAHTRTGLLAALPHYTPAFPLRDLRWTTPLYIATRPDTWAAALEKGALPRRFCTRGPPTFGT